MKEYLVLYRTPVSVLDDWMKTPEEERKGMEEKMQSEWNAWMERHAAHVKETRGAGKATRVTGAGAEDARNDIMMYSFVSAESEEEAAKMFEDHPHLGIPESTIEIMPANPLSGMQ